MRSVAAVQLPDGVSLHVEEYRPPNAKVTVVFLHGWTLDGRLWRRQLEDLPAAIGASAAILTYDVRGHGRSSSAGRDTTTIQQLADDLREVLRARVPADQKIILVGHSLGGMTIFEYAHRYAEEFSERIAGVALISTTCEGVTHTNYGLNPALAKVVRVVEETCAGVLAHSGQWRPHRILMPVLGPGVRWLVFGVQADPDALRLTAAMIGAARLTAIGGFRPSVGTHSRVDVLETLAGAHVSVIVGTHDRLTPRRCAQTIGDAIDHSEQLVLDDVGHMVPLERPDAVTDAVARLCRRVLAGAPARTSAA